MIFRERNIVRVILVGYENKPTNIGLIVIRPWRAFFVFALVPDKTASEAVKGRFISKKWKDLSQEEKVLRNLGGHQANVLLAKVAVLKLLRSRPIEDASFYRKLQQCYELAYQLEERFNKCSNHMLRQQSKF